MRLSELIAAIEAHAPLEYQEDYDNAGLLVGDEHMEVHAALLCIDVVSDTIDEAIDLGADVIVSHHPVIFKPLKNINEKNPVARIVTKAIRNNIALYSVHTNIDNIVGGVNSKLCQKLHLNHVQILSPLTDALKKLVVFVPVSHADQVRQAMFDSGAGKIGSYDLCSYNSEGFGTFRGSDNTNPYVGEKGKIHQEKEIRIETVFPAANQSGIIKAMLEVHPYEEVAYDIYPLENKYPFAGSGMTGELEIPTDEGIFLRFIRDTFKCQVIRHSALLNRPIKKVALCGGSGSFLIAEAIESEADILITSDLKYHDFFKAAGKIVLADIGHYESEQYTVELFYEILTKKFHNFAVHFSKTVSNPIHYIY
ncbi:MAG: Nif3-like dinuclear metal center hexameric protein [Bacteroidales bacterium]|nr:Nif3-like dinuclear metal center hexameric protein [Bacteroidales bacterium]